MKVKLLYVSCILTLALATVGFGSRPAQAARPPQPSEPPGQMVLTAGDQAITYINSHYGPGTQVPAGLSTWSSQDVTPNIIGVKDYRFTSGDWVMLIHYPLSGPQSVVYTIEVTNSVAGFSWAGKVDATGNVTSSSANEPGMPATGAAGTGQHTVLSAALAMLGAVFALAGGLLLCRRTQAGKLPVKSQAKD